MIFIPFVITIVFVLLYNYATDTANIGEEDNITFKTTVAPLFEENGHIHYHDVDEYIIKNILPRHRHQLLYYKILNYQKREDGCTSAIVMTTFLSVFASYFFIRGEYLEPIWAFVISFILNVVLYFMITFLFSHTPIFKKLKLKDYRDVCNVYQSEYHYKYLTDIEESVMFRYFLRKTINVITMFLFILNVWSRDTY